MKTKYAALITAVVLAFTTMLFAVEKQSNGATPKLILLKSNGATIAELKLLKPTTFAVRGQESGEIEQDTKSGRVIFKGGVTIQLKRDGNSSASVRADEIEIIPDVK